MLFDQHPYSTHSLSVKHLFYGTLKLDQKACNNKGSGLSIWEGFMERSPEAVRRWFWRCSTPLRSVGDSILLIGAHESSQRLDVMIDLETSFHFSY